MSEPTMESLLHEERVIPVPETYAKEARIAGMDAYQELVNRASADYEGFWGELARQEITWETPFSQILDESHPPFYRWFADGTLNVSANCLDRHLEAGHGDRTALLWEGEPGDTRTLTYRQLAEEVGRVANALKRNR